MEKPGHLGRLQHELLCFDSCIWLGKDSIVIGLLLINDPFWEILDLLTLKKILHLSTIDQHLKLVGYLKYISWF